MASPFDTGVALSRSEATGSVPESCGNVSREVGVSPELRGEVAKTLMPKANPLLNGEFRATKLAGPNAAVRKRVQESRMFEGEWPRQGQWNRH